ncbi:hypothetical protein IQ254_25550 [Nodosilinea sp. LEGE 07088]|uniref:hypothetical protein n=1 Tax=Nodosilinea sp. LEGE 07088 TaxID=2777968 RepID=UPI00187EFBE2|nr:hypothetical protein [Nodosilinea sp. LEGE 07088]MBE9140524.1 hypothetical protein [Nodosilinea sp. LEGE 07088]
MLFATAELAIRSPRSRLFAAYRRGRAAQFDPDVWQPENLWERSLAEVQGIFGLEETELYGA